MQASRRGVGGRCERVKAQRALFVHAYKDRRDSWVGKELIASTLRSSNRVGDNSTPKDHDVCCDSGDIGQTIGSANEGVVGSVVLLARTLEYAGQLFITSNHP